ncbi:NIPSNAP family protein [Salmonirosea aquatica]|uniref:NIPSNAP family containing protein n=1 Tax=Salmonirosea aquatica TaxID=2654236 RepID=A0A7C9BGB4_9BACT|nr:NIPSNAP family containing protein [Cytophagaceae bacterium SJW1-29]
MKNKLLPRHLAFFLSFVLPFLLFSLTTSARPPKKEYYELKIYHVKGPQMAMMDTYLKNAYIPAAHRAGIKDVGVFKAADSDSLLYVLTPLKSLDQLATFSQALEKDKTYQADGKSYIESEFKEPAYQKFETIVLEAFEGAEQHRKPNLTAPMSQRVYELRSYESPSEKRHLNKVDMFIKGGEIGIFNKLGFNPVFFARVIAGSHMPNLMYMTTFEDKASRDAHWKAFGSDPDWNKLKVMPEYQNNMNSPVIFFLQPKDYSDI